MNFLPIVFSKRRKKNLKTSIYNKQNLANLQLAKPFSPTVSAISYSGRVKCTVTAFIYKTGSYIIAFYWPDRLTRTDTFHLDLSSQTLSKTEQQYWRKKKYYNKTSSFLHLSKVKKNRIFNADSWSIGTTISKSSFIKFPSCNIKYEAIPRLIATIMKTLSSRFHLNSF